MVNKYSQPSLLTDKSRLKEIYDLRVLAWENSQQAKFVNRQFFECGWKDDLDEDAYHFIIEADNSIVASSRVCILQDLSLVEEDFSIFNLPIEKPFAFYSRLVVHPKFRGLELPKLMDEARINFIKVNQIAFTIAWSSTINRQQALRQLGFKLLGYMTHKYGNNPQLDIAPAYILHLNAIVI